MHLITVPPIFPIRLKYLSSSIYVANVTAHTTGELLLDNFQAYVGDKYSSYKLMYNDKDIRFTDTLEKLGIKVNIFLKFMRLYLVIQSSFFFYCSTIIIDIHE